MDHSNKTSFSRPLLRDLSNSFLKHALRLAGLELRKEANELDEEERDSLDFEKRKIEETIRLWPEHETEMKIRLDDARSKTRSPKDENPDN